MFRRSFFARLVATIVLLAILAGGGFMLFRAGQAQGYALGVAAAQSQLQSPQAQPQTVVPAVPYAPYAYPGYFWGYRPFFFNPFGFLFLIGGLFFLFFVVGGLFRFAAFGRFRGRGHGPWGHPGRGPWGGPFQQEQSEQQPQSE